VTESRETQNTTAAQLLLSEWVVESSKKALHEHSSGLQQEWPYMVYSSTEYGVAGRTA